MYTTPGTTGRVRRKGTEYGDHVEGEAPAEAKANKTERTRNRTVRTKGKKGTDDKKQQSARNCKVGQRMRMQRCSGTTEKKVAKNSMAQ